MELHEDKVAVDDNSTASRTCERNNILGIMEH
jgi:hypothetical protein